jgi:hypothetical protein
VETGASSDFLLLQIPAQSLNWVCPFEQGVCLEFTWYIGASCNIRFSPRQAHFLGTDGFSNNKIGEVMTVVFSSAA